ncbi:hypothetical protein KO02_22660 [Sphingobacterium sp. ML3W]|uniref:hypothetical protein n=1 Tax=Sphingobacterium sp. ML3W TaxID=1538644 RepID=UPI0004F7EBCE|nr:hypothetical protein [Sphingobacterium sp. ML3W]AIM39170.1 hypothetical protein KO02_22660 [Sphingobacterium sp. ML3W]
MRKNYYLVTTPLQYCNAINISTEGINILIFLSDFEGANTLFDRIRNSTYWDSTYSFSTYNQAFEFINRNVSIEDYLYIDSDYGMRTALKLRKIKTKEIFVYEEGTGTYRSDLISATHPNKILVMLLKFFGVSEYFGGSRFVKGLYMYDVAKHEKLVPDFHKTRLRFRRSFLDNLELIKMDLISKEQRDFYKKLVAGRDVHLYLTNWNYNIKIDKILTDNRNEMKNENALYLLKPHPRLINSEFEFVYDSILSNSALVEILLIDFKKFSKSLTVYHEGSSALLYLTDINQKRID